MGVKKDSSKHEQARRVLNFSAVRKQDLPSGRRGKHHRFLQMILADLERLRPGEALKVPLDGLNGTKEEMRAALNRAMHKAGLQFSTAADEDSLFIWAGKKDGRL